MKQKMPFGWIVAGLIALFVIILILAKPGAQGTPSSPDTLVSLRPDDWVKGNANAAVTLIEYGDFQCPACASYAGVVAQLEKEFGDRLAIVYRHFPLTQIHPFALPSARAAEAAGNQGKFFPMHDMLFEKQGEWSGSASQTAADELFRSYAAAIGLDVNRFSEDYRSAEIADRVQEDLKKANALRLSGTPSFFLNGAPIRSPGSYDAFKIQIEAALANAPLPETTPDDLANAEDTHEHFDLAVYIKGKQVDLSGSKYQSEEATNDDHDHSSHAHDPFVHLHNQDGMVVHIHKKGVSLAYFLASIGFAITNDGCLVADDGVSYCGEDQTESLKVFVNGKRQADPGAYTPKDLDRILVSYGPLTDPDLQKQLTAVGDESCIYSETCPERGAPPEENCVGGLGTDCAVDGL